MSTPYTVKYVWGNSSQLYSSLSLVRRPAVGLLTRIRVSTRHWSLRVVVVVPTGENCQSVGFQCASSTAVPFVSTFRWTRGRDGEPDGHLEGVQAPPARQSAERGRSDRVPCRNLRFRDWWIYSAAKFIRPVYFWTVSGKYRSNIRFSHCCSARVLSVSR